MKKLALAVSIATLACAGAALAAPPNAGGPDRDRTTTRAEALERANRMFDRADINKDGKLDAGDREARRTAAFDRIDGNMDGMISRAEFTAMRPGMGGRGAGQGEMRGQDGEHQGMRSHGGRGQGMRGHTMRGGMGGGMMMMRMADSDRDSAVTRAEFAAAAASRFDRTDSNRDGQLTPAERQAARAAMRERMQEAMQRRGQGAGMQAPAN